MSRKTYDDWKNLVDKLTNNVIPAITLLKIIYFMCLSLCFKCIYNSNYVVKKE